MRVIGCIYGDRLNDDHNFCVNICENGLEVKGRSEHPVRERLCRKAKLKKDDLEENLISVTSEENWQAPTNILHDIANAAYN